MAQHNYFGFATTQYPPPPPSAYGAAQQTYVPAAQAFAAASTRPTAYAGYDATGQPTAYTYAPQARSAVVTVAVTPQYQAVQVKPTYTTGYSAASTRPVNTVVAPVPKPTATNTYSYVATSSQAVSAYGTPQATGSYGAAGYDAALYSAATNYYQQQQQNVVSKAVAQASWYSKKEPVAVSAMLSAAAAAVQKKPFFNNKPRPKNPQASQIHYCEVCKISCAGPQTYREHLEGQKHKKKEAQAKSGNLATNMKTGQSQLRCDLCDVTCTGTDAYTAHIRGIKHQKTLKLHQRLGKPIPSSDPTIVTASADGTTSAVPVTQAAAKPTPVASTKKVVATPAIRFVGGATLKSLNSGESKEVKAETTSPAVTSTAVNRSASVKEEVKEGLLPGEKLIAPVGHEYIEETLNDLGKLASFFCKLCDCRFNDPNAKDMHLKGRRHRMQYKKKVDPSLSVEVKSNARNKRVEQDRQRRTELREMHYKQRMEDIAASSEMRLLEQDRFWDEWRAAYSDHLETTADKQVLAKHSSIYPTEAELLSVQQIVTACEKALKLVSDTLHIPSKDEAIVVEPSADTRALKGVMRVGELAKGLLLRGNLNVDLVLLCSQKPTETLLNKIVDLLPAHIKEVTDDLYTITKSAKDASITISSDAKPPTICNILLTSPLMREDAPSEHTIEADPTDVLDRQKCLDALAALRHTKWFQARVTGIPSCVLILRVLKELRNRRSVLSPLSFWSMELLLEKTMSTSLSVLGPGDSLRRFFECIAAGILLPGSPGLADPCEREPVDAFDKLTPQQREDITAYAQLCIRQIAFNQMHEILDTEPIPLGEGRTNIPRKRPLATGNDSFEGGADGKKEKTDCAQPNKVDF